MRWRVERPYHSGDEYFGALFKEMRAAKTSIWVEMYIFESGKLGHELADILVRKAQQGLTVRVLIDGLGSSGPTGVTPAFLQQLLWGGVSVRIYHPVHFSAILRILGRGFSRLVSNLNRRNHRKVCIVDGSVAYVGGMNVMDIAVERFGKDKAWRDSSVRVEGQPIKEIEQAFEMTWRRSRRPRGSPETRLQEIRKRKKLRQRIQPFLSALRRRRLGRRSVFSDSLVRMNDRRRLRRENYRALIRGILTSKKRVWIATAYFVPSSGLVYALRFAAWAGVDVRILVPKQSDVFFMPWVAAAFYQSLLHAGIRIFEYVPRFLHTKILILDDRVSVGTSNLNTRSLFHDLEIDVVLREKKSLESFMAQFEKDCEQSEEVTLGRGPHRSWWVRIAGRFALMIQYFL